MTASATPSRRVPAKRLRELSPHKTLIKGGVGESMERTRRRFVFGTVVGIGSLLAGCTAGSSGSESTAGTTTKASDGTTPEATTEPPDTPELTSTERTDSPTERTEPPSTERSTTTTEPPEAPTSPTTGLEILSQEGPLTITEIETGPPGTDPPSIYGERIEFENTGDEPLDVSGHTVEYGGTGKTYEFPSSDRATIDPGGTLRLTTGNGGETIDPGFGEFFAGFETPMLKADGGVITVTDPGETVVLKARY